MPKKPRHSTGVPGLDEQLGGGLIPGTMTVVYGATGIGKTQLGVQYANEGSAEEGSRGIIFDMSSRGDSQNHVNYAEELCGWSLDPFDRRTDDLRSGVFKRETPWGEYANVFGYEGKRVSRKDMDFDGWRDWKSDIVRSLQTTIAFFYGHFLRGVRRTVVDGIEPVDRPVDSMQLEMFEYVYHQVLRKEADWVARDLFREKFRDHAALAEVHRYDHGEVGCVLLCTSHEPMLEDLIRRPIAESDLLSGANTVIYMGKTHRDGRFGRGLYVAKHRGSACNDEVIPYEITDAGLRVLTR